MDEIEDAFGIPRGGPWNRLAVSYVGLCFPLSAGWKLRLADEGADPESPVAKGIDPGDWRWLSGHDEGHRRLIPDAARRVDPAQYALIRVDALEAVLNDLMEQGKKMKMEIRALRDMLSEDGF